MAKTYSRRVLMLLACGPRALALCWASRMNADEYRKLAEVEDQMWYFRALHGHIERALVAACGGSPATVLDAGCGTGGLIGRLTVRHPRWRWAGIDISELAHAYATKRMAESATAGGPVADLRLGSITAMPFSDAEFDAVVSADVLYHVDDDGAALREFARVLRPGGAAIINVPAYQWLWSYHDVAVHSRRRYGRTELLTKLRAAGLAPVRATYWNTIPFPLVVVRRKLLPPPRGGSDVQLYPRPVEAVFDVAMALERAWLAAAAVLPFGTSVFVVARKPLASPPTAE